MEDKTKRDAQREAQRDTRHTVIPVSMPRSLVRDIDDRANAFSLSRSKFIAIIAESAVRRPGPLLIYAEQEQATERIELSEEAITFLCSAIPEMMAFERQVRAGEAIQDLPKPSRNVTRSKLWEFFEEERGEILRHKWNKSKEMGYDIGMEAALRDWLERHHDKWLDGRKSDD